MLAAVRGDPERDEDLEAKRNVDLGLVLVVLPPDLPPVLAPDLAPGLAPTTTGRTAVLGEEADFLLTFVLAVVFGVSAAVLAVLAAGRFRGLVAVGIEELL